MIQSDPFAATELALGEPDPVRDELRSAGPVVQVTAPAGGPAWIVTEESLARAVLGDLRFAKDPAFAPAAWNGRAAGLERTAAEQPSLTTLDGPAHTELRRAHAPLLSAKRIQAQSGRIHETARELLGEAGPEVDLMAGFTTRFPLTVLLDLLGIPLDLLERASDACRQMFDGPAEQDRAIGALAELAAFGLKENSRGLAAELRDRMPAGTTEDELRYHLFALIFAGQLTTDAALGFAVARALTDHSRTPDELARDTLRHHPPAPYTLWRFTTTEVDLAGVRLPANAPVLVDIQGINATSSRDLAFGAGPHFCIGAQLAQLELRAVVSVLRTDFPQARLAVPVAELRHSTIGGIMGSRLRALPVRLHG